MTEHILMVNAAAIEINKQPRTKDDLDHAQMIKNKLRLVESGDDVMLQIRGETHYAQVVLSPGDVAWLTDILAPTAMADAS